MFVRRLWPRGGSRNLHFCCTVGSHLLLQENCAASVRSECSSARLNVGFVLVELLEGSHGFLPGASICRDFHLGFAPYSSTRRWLCTTNAACLLNSNANFIETGFLEQGDGMPGIKVLPKISQKGAMLTAQNNVKVGKNSLLYQKDLDAYVVRKTSNRLSSPHAGKSAGTSSNRGESSIREKYPIHGCNWSDCEITGNCDGDDVENGEESAQHGQIMDKKPLNPLEKRTASELAKLLEKKGWAESTKEFLLRKLAQRELSCLIVSRVIVWLKDVSLASSLFQWVCDHMGHDVSMYHAYLKALGEAKRFDDMWSLLAKMKGNGVEVSFIAFCYMIRACRTAGAPAMAVEVLKRASEHGIELNVELYQALLSALFLSNLGGDAKLLYSRMVEQGLSCSIHTYNTLIYGFGLTSGIEDVARSFNMLLKAGVRPNLSTYAALISAYCNVHAIDKAMSVFLDLRRSGLTVTAITMNIIVEALCKESKLDDAVNLIDSVRDWCLPDTSTFIIVFNACLSCEKISKAIHCFQIMEEEGLTNQWVYINLSNGLRQCPQTKEMQDFLKGLFHKHGFGNGEVCHALLHNFILQGQINEAEDLFNGMREAEVQPTLSSYTTMISLYGRLKMPDRALQLFAELKERGFKPNVFCYTPIIGALLNANRIADARKCYLEMLDHGYESNAITCNHLLTEVCKQDMVAGIPEILSGMLRSKFAMRSSTFFQLAKCMCKVGKIKETNILCRSFYELQCLELDREAAQQIFAVMKVMSASILMG